MQDNDTSRRRKFYDQMSEAYDLGTFEEFDTKMNNPESRRKLHEFIDQDGKYDIGDFEYFDNAMKPSESPAPVSKPETAPQVTAPAAEPQQPSTAVEKPAAPVQEPEAEEFPQPTDVNGNVLTHNGQPYSQEVLRRYYSPDNKAGQFRDLSTIASDLERDESVSRMRTTGGAGYVPPQNHPIAEPQQESNGRTPEQQAADEQAAQRNDEVWRNDPTLQQRKEYNARNAILLDPTIPRDQRSVFQKENRQNLIDVSNPRYASIIHHNEAVDEGMRVFDEAMKKAEEEGRQSIVNALRNSGGLESLANAMNPNGDIMPGVNAIRQGNETADPQKVMDKVVRDVSDSLMKDEYFTKDGKLNDAGRYAIMDLRQRMVQQLVDARVPKSTAEYVVLTAIKNSDIGKLTRMATNTAYENWLDDVAASQYDAGFWEKVFNGTLTFGLNLPEYLGTGVAGGAVSRKIIGDFTKRTANELMKRGVQKATAERAAQMVINNSMAGTATKLGAGSAAGATTFGLQPVIGEPIDITYQAGQPGIIEGSINTPGLSDYLTKTVKEMGKNTAMGALMVGGAAAKTAEKIAEGAVKEGIARGAAGLAYDSSVMAYFSLQDMKEQMPDFEITPQTAAEAFAESAASLGLLKAPHMFSLKGKIKDAKEFNRKFNFTPEDKEVLQSMGISNPLDMVEKLAYKGATPETIRKGKGDVTLPSADNIQGIDAEAMQQLTSQYRTFMASDAPETLKAKVQYLIEGKMPQQFSAPVESRVVERNGNVYLETVNENGGVIESRKMKDLLSAEKERMQMNYDIDMNKTAAMERRLNEQEVVSDFAGNLAREYEEARVKSLSGEELTAEERQAVYLYQNFDMLQAALERQAAGAELLPEQQALINAMAGRTKAYVNRNNASRQVSRQVEQQFGLQEGELDKIMNGHTKDEAMAIADETGEQVFEVGNGIYRTNSEFNIIEKYREALLNRINENIARKNAEDVAQAAEQAQIQETTPRIESQPGAGDASDFGGENGGTPPPDETAGGGEAPIRDGYSGITPGYSETSGTSGQTEDAPSDETLVRRDAAYDRGNNVAADETQLPQIAYDQKLAVTRMAQMLPDSNPVTARLRQEIMNAVNTDNDDEADRIIADAVRNGLLTTEQAEAVDQWRDAVETQRGVDDAIFQQIIDYEAQQRQQLDIISAPDHTVTELLMKDGSTRYWKSGDLNNRHGGVMTSDSEGNVLPTPVGDIKAIAGSRSVDEILSEAIDQYADDLHARYAGMSDNSILTQGRQVEMVMSGQTVNAVVAGTDQQGNVVMQLSDGSQMAMPAAEAQRAVNAADDMRIQAQLQAEKEAAVAQQQTQRFTNGIKGFAEGQPDLTAPETDAAVAAEYIKSLLGANGQDPEKARKNYLEYLQNTREQLKSREVEADNEIRHLTQWLEGNEDIASPDEVADARQRIDDLTNAVANIQQRQQKYGELGRNLMTPEERNAMEQQRRREIFKAGSGYQPALPQRNIATNADRITTEDGQPNFGLTSVGNANNYLLRNFDNSVDAERFINEQRLALRNRQRDEVQAEIDRRKDLLNAYAQGLSDLTPDQVTQTVHEMADLEAYQDALSQEAVRLREIADGIPALYERNGREEQLTPAEQRGKELDRATDRESKRKIAQRVYAGNDYALGIINDQEPKTVEEYISQSLPIGKMNWEGFDRGERHINGVQESVFGKNGATRGIGKGYSTNAFNMYLAPEGEGMGFDEMVHYLYEDAPEVDGRKLYDDTQIRDALINMLLTAQKPSDISHLLINNRIEDAEAHIREEERLEREAEEEAKYQELQEWADAHHLEPEEVESYKDYLEEKPWEFEEDIINQIIADDEYDRQSKEMDRQHPDRPAGSEGEGGQGQVQISGTAEGAGANTPVEGQQGAEGGAGSPSVPDNNVSGGEQAAEHLTAIRNGVDEYLKKYNPLAPVEVLSVDSDDDMRKIAGDEYEIARETLKDTKLPAAFEPESKKIFIFAENIDAEDLEQGIFHESVHRGLQQYYGDGLREVAEAFWETESPTNPEKSREGKEKTAKAYKDKPEDIKEEYLTHLLSLYMAKGKVDKLLSRLSPEHQEIINNILKNIGYDTAGETKQRTAKEELEGNTEEVRSEESGSAGGGLNESFSARLAKAKEETDTNPTEAQKKAGNYKMGHLKFSGYNYSIENPKGSTRSGVDKNGQPWSIEMQDTYGYILRKIGVDGDHLDMFINDDADLDTFDGRVYVVDQKNEDGTFDEHKVMYGYQNWMEARRAYERNYEPGWWDKHVMKMTGVTKQDFDKWLSDSDHKTKPFAEYNRTKNADTITDPIDQLRSDIIDRQQKGEFLSLEPSWTEKEIGKKDVSDLRKLREKSKKDASVARVLLGTTNIEKGSSKDTRLRHRIAQAEFDIDYLDKEIAKRQELFRQQVEDIEAGGAMIDHLQDMGVDVSDDISEIRRARKKAENDNSKEGRIRKMTTSDGSVYGFAYRGKLYLDPRKLDANLPLHEYGHLWCEAFRRLNPEGWKEIVGVMKQDADTWNFVRQLNPDLTSDDDIAEEVITTGSGRNGQQRIMQEFERMSQKDPSYKGKWSNIWKNISKAIQDFWKKVGDFLHIKYETPQQVYDQVLKDFASGVNPRKKVEEYLRQRDADYLKAASSGDVAKATRIFNDALKENVGNGMTPYIAVDNYRKLQQLARKVKKGDAAAIERAAEMMSPLIPDNAVLIPAPSHEGKATDMLQLANAIAGKTGSTVADILTSTPRRSQYENKKKGGKALPSSELGIKMTGKLPEGKIPVVIDNVVDSGNTAEACIRALGTGIVASLADSADKNTHAATLKSASPVVLDKDGNIIPLSKRFDLGSRYLGRKTDAIDQLFGEIENRKEAAEELQGENEVQTAIEKDEAGKKMTAAEKKIHQRATEATVKAVSYTGVPIRQVSQEETDQMMQVFVAMNRQAIADYARQMRPDKAKRYAVINVRDPYGVPNYFEKKRFAQEFQSWANRGGGNYQTFDLSEEKPGSQELTDAANIQPMAGWHGSGAVFTKFDHSHMGEGAGSQSFGWGTYLTDSKSIGKDYAELTSKGWTFTGKDRKGFNRGKSYQEEAIRNILLNLDLGYHYVQAVGKERNFIQSIIRDYEENFNDLSKEDLEDLKDCRAQLSFINSLKESDFERSPKNLYKVEIPDDNGSNYFEWYKAIDQEMADKLKSALIRTLNLSDDNVRQKAQIEKINRDFDDFVEDGEDGGYVYNILQMYLKPDEAKNAPFNGSDKAVSEFLSDLGYVGIKYPAGTLMGGGNGATNYVIFKENDARIVDHIQFMIEQPQEPQPIFVSNALKAVEGIRQEKATPEQWLKMIEKAGGIKAGEEKWLELGDWLKSATVKSLTKKQILDYINTFKIDVEETKYREYFNVDDNPQMQELQAEFDEIVKNLRNEKDANQKNIDAFDEEMFEKYGAGWHNKLNDEDKKRDDALVSRYEELEDIHDLAFQEMVSRHGDNFEMAFEYNPGRGALEPQMDMYGDELSDAAKHFLQFEEQPINSTRLAYTTEGLENKKEIALTVPTIDPYNESDQIHFGDAGEGRAVAWVRFGETTDADGNKVLVIDEIQSKRHQDAREMGYGPNEVANLPINELERAYLKEKGWYISESLDKNDWVIWYNEEPETTIPKNPGDNSDDVLKQYAIKRNIQIPKGEELKKYAPVIVHHVPSAPFEKNWHELAMKRMLRYAAENGYDKIAWTTGEQQAERYNLSRVVEDVESGISPGGIRNTIINIDGDYISFDHDDNGNITRIGHGASLIGNAKTLSDVVGKELALKILSQKERGSKGVVKYTGDDLRIGGEGMKGFYDQILPRFMDKYGKKWGVKTSEIDLPDIGDQTYRMNADGKMKKGLTMHSIDVTPEMKESVMHGQPMFQKSRGGKVYGWTDGTGIFLTPLGLNPNTPMHEYTHIWDKYIQKHDPKLWQEMVDIFKKTAAWQQLRENPDYRSIWNDDDRMASEVHSRLTGARSQEEFEKAAANPDNKDAADIIRQVRDVLRRFWQKLAQLFGFGRDRLEEFVLMPLRDALEGFNPIKDDYALDPVAMMGWHGSAAKFDKFDHSKMGSGEGQAVSGYGTYITTSEGTARYYAQVAQSRRRKVVQEMGYTVDGNVVKDPALVRAADYLKKTDGNSDEAIKACQHTIDVINRHKDKNPFAALGGNGKSVVEEAMDYLLMEQQKPGTIGFQEEIVEQPDKQLYEVDIPDDNGKNYLDLDARLTKKQKAEIKKRFLEVLDNSDEADYWKKNRDIIDYDWKYVDSTEGTGDAARGVMEQFLDSKKVSEIFSDMGYVGSKTKGSDGTTYIIYNDNDIKIANRIQFQIEPPMMAGDSRARSLMEGNLFSDADFLPEPKPKRGKAKSVQNMSDGELLKAIAKKDGKERRSYIDEYDRRHETERKEEKDSYYDMLESSNTSLEDAMDMYNNVFRQFSNDGYASPERTKLLAQSEALEDYIEELQEREAEREMELEEEEDTAVAQQAEPAKAGTEQRYEQQKQEMRQIGPDLTQLKLRPLEEGETCHVERRYVENGMFSFTGKERIESIDDVAYIFKQLEDAAIENTFLVLEKEGVPTIIHLATGLYTASYAKADPALAAYNELKPDKVYFIHNHPSGNLMCSKADEDVLKTMSKIFGNKLQPGIIIDTKSGKYGLFGNTLPISPSTQNKMLEKVEGEVPMRVYSFSKQVFDADWNPETAFDAGTAVRVAKFVSSHRMGGHKKTSLIVMTQNWKVTGNVFLPWTNLKEAISVEGADLIARYMNQMGGTIVTLYGDYDFSGIDSSRRLQRLKNMLSARGVYLADVIHVDNDKLNYKSAHEMGMIGEPGLENGRAGEADIIEMQPKKRGNIEDDYSEKFAFNEIFNMEDRVKMMSPNELVENYKRLNSEMLDENGLDIDEQEDEFRRKWAAENGWPPAPGSGFGKASADHFKSQIDKYTYKKIHIRWTLLDRIEELGLQDYLNKDDLPDKETATIVKMYRRATPEIEKLNHDYNVNLTKLINGKLDKGFVFDMGMPSVPLLTTGFPNLPIRMQASVLNTKTHDPAHPYSYSEVYDLVKHIQRPLAIFEYGDKDKAQNLMIGISQNVEDGKQFLVGLSIEPVVKGVRLPYNSVRNVFPKNFHDWIHWIAQGRMLRVDGKKEIQDIIDALRINPVDYIDKNVLNSAAKIVKDFKNPKLSEEKLRNIYGNFAEVAEETADILGGQKVILEAESPEEGTLGWYDPNDNTIHVVLPEHSDIGGVKRTVFHEKLGHEGLVALLGSQEEVNKFGQFVFDAANDKVYKRILDKANEIDPSWTDHQRFSKAAQEVIADIAENGPRTADEFSLWRKIKHYLIRFLNRIGLKVRGLLNDHDLAYYILKTGEALKKWNKMPEAEKKAAARQYDVMRSRRGKPRKRNNESMAQYLQRLREWEMWKIAEEQARENNDPMPDADQINERWHEQFNRDMDEWRRSNNIADGESLGEFPKRRSGETPQEYAARVADYETQADAWRGAPSLFDYLQRANDEYRQAYADWKMRYGIREAENVDLGLYEGDPDSLPHIVDPEDLEADNRAEADLAEAVGIDMSSDGARRHTKIAVIERRKNLESANAEDAIWIHDLVKRLNEEAKRQGVTGKELREAMADIIEGTYFEEVLKDEQGNVVVINDISNQLPIKMTPELQEILNDIKDWYDYFFHAIEDAGLRNDAGYIEEGYVNHVWSREKSNPEAWKKYVENFQRTKSPNMRERLFETYRDGRDVGLVQKYTDIADILAHYSSSNNQAIANKKFLDDLSFIVVEELNGDGEVVSVLPLLNSQKPNIAVSDRYKMYQVPGVGDVYVLKDVQRTFANVFGTMRTQDIPDWLSQVGKIYDVGASTAKKIELAFSAFHMGALTEVAFAQMRPDRALRALAQYIIFDCAKTGTIPAYAHPEDFKFAASHLVQLGATQDYSAADVNNVTEKIREFVRELADSEGIAKKGAGYAATPLAFALDMVNKGFDKVLWNYLHDGLKIACFKMFAEQIAKRVAKEGLTPEKREELLDEAGQYVNDTFGGQYFELMNVSPALLKWLRRAFLSPDWLLSTQRHFLANFGFGSLYSESGFMNYLRYNRDNIKRALGADIPRDENRRFRSSNAKKCYLLGVCAFFYVMMNAINAMFRAWDEDKEKEKAEEERRTNPDYRSGYELAYPDGMKWYDYTMYGNTVGQQTHLFLGRYDDGTEWYARWGKQFREFPELFMGRHGFEFPTPLMERMSGKANPIGRYLLYDLPLTVGMYGYRQPRETQEIAEKYGNTVALLAMTAKKFLPFSVPTQEDKEFKMFDLVMPSQKGFTRWKAVDFFKTYVQAGDMDGIQRTYNAAVMNGIDAEDCLKAAIATVQATQKKELQDGIVDLQSAMEHFDNAKGTAERKLMKRRIIQYLAEQNYKTFTRDEAIEQVNSFLNGTTETDNDINKYVELQTSGDVRDDYRLSMIRKQAKKFVDEVKTAEGERQKKLADTYQPWLEIDQIIKTANSQIGKLKRQLGKGQDDAAIMKQIREIRSQAQKLVDDVKAP